MHGRLGSGGGEKQEEQLEPESWSQTQGCRGTKAMPDVEKVSVRVHLRAHGGGGRGGKTGEES